VEERDSAVVISAIERAGPAARAGVRAGDLVVAINGDRIDSSRGLIRAVAAVPPGRDLRLTVRRQGREVEIPVTVGRRPQDSAG
jgi:serine protease Do